MMSTEESLVTVIVSDPWEFPDENEGRLSFLAAIVDETPGRWLLHFLRPIAYEGRVWNFAIPSPRHVGQNYFEGHRLEDTSANVLFITDQQAQSPEFFATFDDMAKPSTPWVIGSVQRGRCAPIAEGEDSHVEPRWSPVE